MTTLFHTESACFVIIGGISDEFKCMISSYF
jgi:hypothetical protein